MKKIAYILLAVVGFTPVFASASTVYSSSVSSSNTGGITAGAGQSVLTQDSDSYSEVRTTITSNGGGGTSTTYTKTSTNGVVHEKSDTKNYAPGESITVVASSSAGSKGSNQTVNHSSGSAQGVYHTQYASTTGEGHAFGVTSSTSSSSMPHIQLGLRARLFTKISQFFGSIFGWFGK